MRTVGGLPPGIGEIAAPDHVACVGSGSSDLARIPTHAFDRGPDGAERRLSGEIELQRMADACEH
jgi:hypothetical protein